MKIVYSVIAFRQQAESPIQVAFVAHAGEVVRWAGIPRKSDELLTGFQRFKDDTRIDTQIVPFFSKSPKNCSPTAVIVALRSNSGMGTCRLKDTNIPVGKVVNTELTIEVDDEGLLTDKVFESAQAYVNSRLAPADIASEEESAAEEGEESPDEEDEDNSSEETEDSENAEDSTVHLGSETLVRMKKMLDDKSNWANEKFKSAIADYVKPAFLIDGQHRIFAGARFGDKGLPFIVCGLYDAPWEEQVFQFTVVNLKPKKIPPSLISSIAGLSLSRHEQNLLEDRLSQAGVVMTEVTIMSLVAYDDRSPFAELVDMGVGHAGKDSSKLGFGSIRRIAKVWHRASRNSLTQIAKAYSETNNASRARNHWRENKLWFDFFCDFWKTIREYYPDSLWKKSEGNKLFIGAHLWALQEALLIEADGQMRSHWKIEPDLGDSERYEVLKKKLLEVITTSLEYLPSDLWTTRWEKQSQDTNQGREDLVSLFRKLIDEGKKIGKVWKGWKQEEWFKQA